MSASMVQIGAREFREELPRFLESETPLAIVQDGRTIGYYIPARASGAEDEDKLWQAVTRLEALLDEHGVTEEEIVRDFKAWRRSRR